MKEKGGLSSSQEDYLKQIYVLAQRSEEVRVTDIAKLLEISKPSVNRAMNTLKEQGYIEHEHYGTIKLTKEGVAAGKNIHETYKTAYKFLTEFLGVSAAEAEEEAHLMEHAMSKEMCIRDRNYLMCMVLSGGSEIKTATAFYPD